MYTDMDVFFFNLLGTSTLPAMVLIRTYNQKNPPLKKKNQHKNKPQNFRSTLNILSFLNFSHFQILPIPDMKVIH